MSHNYHLTNPVWPAQDTSSAEGLPPAKSPQDPLSSQNGSLASSWQAGLEHHL